MHHASTSIICYVHIEQLSILDNLRFLGFELAWRFVTIDRGNEVNSNDVYMMLLALLVPDSTNMDHWINHWLSETVVVCFKVKVITTLLVPGLGMAWRSSPIWVSLGVVAGWDQTSRSCLNKFHTTAIASSFLIAYQDFPHIQQSVSFVDPIFVYFVISIQRGAMLRLCQCQHQRALLHLHWSWELFWCDVSHLYSQKGTTVDSLMVVTTKLSSTAAFVDCAGVLSHCWEATHRVTLALLAPWILQAKMRNIWKTYCVWQGHVV